MVSLRLLGTAWTVWKVARKRFGLVGAVIATAIVLGGMVYLMPVLAVKYPAIAAIVKKIQGRKLSASE